MYLENNNVRITSYFHRETLFRAKVFSEYLVCGYTNATPPRTVEKMFVSKPQNLLGSFHLTMIIFVLVEYFAIFSRLSDALNIKMMFTWPVLCISFGLR